MFNTKPRHRALDDLREFPLPFQNWIRELALMLDDLDDLEATAQDHPEGHTSWYDFTMDEIDRHHEYARDRMPVSHSRWLDRAFDRLAAS